MTSFHAILRVLAQGGLACALELPSERRRSAERALRAALRPVAAETVAVTDGFAYAPLRLANVRYLPLRLRKGAERGGHAACTEGSDVR